MNKRKKILFVRQGQRSFFEIDLEILREFFEVQDFDNYPPSISKWPSLMSAVLDCDLVYIWFMGKHAVLPLLLGKLLGKKVILVAGGWDAADCPEISYGLMRRGWMRVLLRSLFQIPDMVLAVSDSNREEILKNVKISGEKVRLIYHGFRASPDDRSLIKERKVITIGEITQSNLKRKGLELFVKAAALLPNIPFLLIGKDTRDGSLKYLQRIASPNVKFTGYVSDAEKDAYMKSAAVYAQFSYHEAFGCAVAEAMLYGCVPVVTDRGSLPEVVGDTGRIIPFDDVKAAAGAIHDVLSHNELGEKGRRRIREQFPFENRMQSLKRLVESIYER